MKSIIIFLTAIILCLVVAGIFREISWRKTLNKQRQTTEQYASAIAGLNKELQACRDSSAALLNDNLHIQRKLDNSVVLSIDPVVRLRQTREMYLEEVAAADKIINAAAMTEGEWNPQAEALLLEKMSIYKPQY